MPNRRLLTIALGLSLVAGGSALSLLASASVSRRAQMVDAHTLAPALTVASADNPCLVVPGGEVSGTILHEGEPVPDGVAVAAQFTGGPLVWAPTRDGQYTLPQLARACADGITWLDFQLRAGGGGVVVRPEQWQTLVDVDAPRPVSLYDPTHFPMGAPSPCSLVLGTISGRVLIGGAPAPDGSVVSALMGPGGAGLSQAVRSRDGRYMLTTVGIHCAPGEGTFLQVTLTALGTTVTVTPEQVNTSQDITSVPQEPTSQRVSARTGNDN